MANTALRVRVQREKQSMAEIHREKLVSALEKMREAARATFRGGEAIRILSIVDQLQERCLSGDLDMESLISSLQDSRGQTRKSMREKPQGMVRVLNSIDAVEQEIVDFTNFLRHAIEK